MKTIRIYWDLWYKYQFLDFLNSLPLIKESFSFIEDSINPQIVFYWNKKHLKNPIRSKYKCPHLFHCMEYLLPDMHTWDYALKWDYNKHERTIRFPAYVWYGAGEDLIKPANYDPEKILRSKKKFCAFVYGKKVTYRNKFFDILNSYKHVDSPGVQCNNMSPLGGYKTPKESRYSSKGFNVDLLPFLNDYKFVIAIENSMLWGYVTEKIYHAMLCNSVPIYLGNDMIHTDFNVNSFINIRGFFSNRAELISENYYRKKCKEVAQYILALDNNDKAYCDLLSQPWYTNNIVNEYADKNNIANFFIKIFESL
jgi:hypothetical protein